MCSRVSELILLVVASCHVDEDAKVVLSRSDLDTRSGELCRELIKPPRSNALLWAVYEEC